MSGSTSSVTLGASERIATAGGSSGNIDRIHFASCNSQHYENLMWPHMETRKPAAFVWVGDAIYSDDFEWIPPEERQSWSEWYKRRVKESTPEIMQRLYRDAVKHPGYRAYLHADDVDDVENATRPIVMGTFDDHDYGRDNGDHTYQYKRESAMAYMDFIQQSNGDPSAFTVMKRRAEAGKGLYGVKVLDFTRPKGHQLLTDQEAGLDPDVVPRSDVSPLSDRSVAIFVLDSRSNKTPWPSEATYHPTNSEGDFLGEEQWAWLEEALGRSTAAVNFIAQGLQVHPGHMFDGRYAEEWG